MPSVPTIHFRYRGTLVLACGGTGRSNAKNWACVTCDKCQHATTRLCHSCGQLKSHSEFGFFGGVLRTPCNECRKRYTRTVNYPRHRTRILRRAKDYNRNHRPRKRVYDIRYRPIKNARRRFRYETDSDYRARQLAANRQRRESNPSRHRDRTNIANDAARMELRPYYVRATMRRKLNGVHIESVKHFPPELVETKRKLIQIHRVLKTL